MAKIEFNFPDYIKQSLEIVSILYSRIDAH